LRYLARVRRFAFTLIISVTVALLACGDGAFIFAFSTGTIAGEPVCDGGGGSFDLRDQAGLVIVVVIESDTTIILAGGSTGTCADLGAGANVDVSGDGEGRRITARNIVVQ
jgi:hypothetical protein